MKASISSSVRAYTDRLMASPVFSSREIYRMTLPFILDSMSVMFISMLITALITSAGESSVAAVNLVSPIFTLIICLLNGIAAGGTVAVTQSFGSGNIKRTRESAGHILWLTVILGTALSLILILFPRPLLMALYPKAEPVVMDKAVRYMVEGSFSLIIFTVYTGVFCILRGLGESKKCLALSIIINVAYLLFSILFINVLKMDIQGSALAQILARAVGSLCALALLFLPKKMPVRMRFRDIFSYRQSILSSIMQVSVPFGLEQIFLYGGNIVVTSMMVPLGTSAVATNAIAVSLFGIVTAAANAAGTLGVTVVGRCVGAQEKTHAFRYGYKVNILALLLLALAAGLFYPLFPFLLAHLYQAEATVLAEALRLLYSILIPMFLFWPVSNVMPYVLRAANDTVFPSVLSLLSMWVVRIGLGYVLTFHFQMGLDGLWIAMWAEWAVRSVILAARFFSKKWLSKGAKTIDL